MPLDAAAIEADRAHLRLRWYREGYYSRHTLSQTLQQAARDRPHTRFHFHSEAGSHTATTLEIEDAGWRAARALQALGVRPGDVIAMQLPTWYATTVLYVGAIHAGATLLPIVHTYGPAEVGFMLRDAHARFYAMPENWCGRDYRGQLAAVGPLPDLHSIVVVRDNAPDPAITWEQLKAVARAAPVGSRPSPDSVCLLLYTSGTTASPKGVRHTHNTVRVEWSIPFIHGGGPYFNPFPAGHIAGFNFMLRSLLTGTEMVYVDRWDASLAAELIGRYKVRQTGGTPYFLQSLLEAAVAGGRDLSTLSMYALGGTAVTPDHVMMAERAGFVGCRLYGLTEHSTVTGCPPGTPVDKRAYTDGRIQPGTEVKVVDDAGNDLGHDAEGEILVRGPELFIGYTDRALDRDAFAPGGWFRTGDIGRVDAEGFLTITDRKKDIIVRGGENISSKEVEAVLARYPGVQEVAVVAMPDERYGEKVCAFVVPRPGESVDVAAAQRHFAAAGVARHKTPEAVVLVADLPRTPAGKVMKWKLRNALRSPAGDRTA